MSLRSPPWKGSRRREAAGAVDAGVTVAVVGGALVGVGENLVGLAALLELLLGLGIVRVAVGVELHGELAIRGLDLAVGGGAFDTQDLVVVGLHRCGCHS